MTTQPQIKTVCSIAFVSTAFNEESNLDELYRQCLHAFENLSARMQGYQLTFSMLLVDNGSSDRTPEIIKQLMGRDPRVTGIRNLCNYGPESSFIQGLSMVESDLVVLLCADLQDPPEIAGQMLFQLITDKEGRDAVLACKRRSAGSMMIRSFRKLYYRLLSFSDRDTHVLPGFHGFGCYHNAVVKQALELWQDTPMNMRSCLSAASTNPGVVNYEQPDRIRGKSSYGFMGYVSEASAGIVAGKSLASRLSLRLGIGFFILSIMVGIFVLLNLASGNSGYARGVPTLAILIMLSSSFQVIILSLISRQIEHGLHQPSRPKVRFRSL